MVDGPHIKMETAILEIITRVSVAAAPHTDGQARRLGGLDSNGHIPCGPGSDDNQGKEDTIACTIPDPTVLLIVTAAQRMEAPGESTDCEVILHMLDLIGRGKAEYDRECPQCYIQGDHHCVYRAY